MFQTMRKLTGILAIIILLSELNTFTYGSPTTTSKCQPMKSGVYYAGDIGPRNDNITTPQACQSLCENDPKCYAWQYQSSSQACWLQTSVVTQYTGSSYMSGYCIGHAAKETCTEVLSNMYYNGDSSSAINNVATSQDCMSKCNADSTCLGWSYSSTAKNCWTQTTVLGAVTDTKYVGGSCIIPQAPYPTISIDTYRQQVLDTHNSYRNNHDTPAVEIDPELNDIAQAYAEKMATTKVFAHSGNTFNGNALGENIYMISGLSAPMYAKGSDAVASWYGEISSYNWAAPGFGTTTGHFTQLVWKGTEFIGIGRALTSDNSTLYVVVNYYPAGNMGNLFPTNVLKLS